ncbi:MAG TPA: ATP-binding protein [Dissulfurispiraceae bacterium]|nr:ATP-binding protein [Dissulfurispiraceae bacterium]
MDPLDITREFITVTVDKSHIITIGERLYAESIEFIREIVNNAYDADATLVEIAVSEDGIEIRDNGTGMDREGLHQYFNIGSQQKLYSPKSPVHGRDRIGQFGIGKFASLSACERFGVLTKRGGFVGRVVFDKEEWEKAGSEWSLPLEILPADFRADDNAKGVGGAGLPVSESHAKEKLVAGDEGPPKEKKKRKKRPKVKLLTPNAAIKKIKFGQSGVSCCVDGFGEEGPEVFTEENTIYINKDHPLYKRESGKLDTHTLNLARLITQEIALMKDSKNPRQAFERQSRLLKDAFIEEAADNSAKRNVPRGTSE